MKRYSYLILLVLLVGAVSALTIENGTQFNPSWSNITYIFNYTNSSVTFVTINETCLQVDNNNFWCNQSATPLDIYINNITEEDIFSDINPQLSPGITSLAFKPSSLTQNMTQPEGQNSTLGIFNITNNGTASAGVMMNINYTETGYTLMMNSSNVSAPITLTSTYKYINTSLGAGDSFMVWLFMNYSTPTTIYNYIINFTNSSVI